MRNELNFAWRKEYWDIYIYGPFCVVKDTIKGQ